MRPPFETFKNPVCKGSFVLNTACGNCERCDWEQRELARLQAEAETKAEAEAPRLTIQLSIDKAGQAHLEVSGEDQKWEAVARAAGEVFLMDLREAIASCVHGTLNVVRA